MSTANPTLVGLVKALRPCSVAVVGDVMLDRYVRGQVHRLSPEAPIQVLEVDDEYQMPGGAANVAMKVVGLGLARSPGRPGGRRRCGRRAPRPAGRAASAWPMA